MEIWPIFRERIISAEIQIQILGTSFFFRFTRIYLNLNTGKFWTYIFFEFKITGKFWILPDRYAA